MHRVLVMVDDEGYVAACGVITPFKGEVIKIEALNNSNVSGTCIVTSSDTGMQVVTHARS